MRLSNAEPEKWDDEYAWAVHCNIACPIMDELNAASFATRHTVANRAAARVMKQLFNIDITKNSHWIET